MGCSRTFIVVVAIFAAVAASPAQIKTADTGFSCYVCETQFYNTTAEFERDECYSPTDKIKPTVCPPLNNSAESYGCLKIYTVMDTRLSHDYRKDVDRFHWRISRSCATFSKKTDECGKQRGANSETNACFCRSSNCNGADRSVVASGASLLVTLLLAATIFARL